MACGRVMEPLGPAMGPGRTETFGSSAFCPCAGGRLVVGHGPPAKASSERFAAMPLAGACCDAPCLASVPTTNVLAGPRLYQA